MMRLPVFPGHHLRGNLDRPNAPLPGDYRSNQRAFRSLAPVTNPDSDARFIAPKQMGIGTDEWIFSATVAQGRDEGGRLRRLSVFATRKVTGAWNLRTLCPGLRQWPLIGPYLESYPTEQAPTAVIAVRDLDDSRLWMGETAGRLLPGSAFAFVDPYARWKMRSLTPDDAEELRQNDPFSGAIPHPRGFLEHGGALYAVQTPDFKLNAVFGNAKPAVAHGDRGRYLNDQIPGFPLLTRYASRTRQRTLLHFEAGGERMPLSGFSWSDHQSLHLDRYFALLTWRERLQQLFRLADTAAHWQWLPLHLSDGSELNLFTVWTSKSRPVRQFNAGFHVAADGTKTELGLGDFEIRPHADSVTKQGEILAPTRWDIVANVPGAARYDMTIAAFAKRNDVPLKALGTTHDVIEAAVDVTGQRQAMATRSPVYGTGWVEIVLMDLRRILRHSWDAV